MEMNENLKKGIHVIKSNANSYIMHLHLSIYPQVYRNNLYNMSFNGFKYGM